jgi:hypothetical protein
MLPCNMIRNPQPRPATSCSPRPLALSPLTYTYPPILCLSPLTASLNSTRPCRRNPSAINRIPTLSVTHGGAPPCPLSTLNVPLRAALCPPVRISVHIKVIPRHLAALCFHTLAHSFARSKTLSPIFSFPCALFAQNTLGGVALDLPTRQRQDLRTFLISPSSNSSIESDSSHTRTAQLLSDQNPSKNISRKGLAREV